MSALHRLLVCLLLASTWPRALAAQTSGDKLVFVVRHAEKASATDPDSPLSEAGRARAAALAAALRDANIAEVIVTSRKRTQETGAPIADARHLIATVVPLSANAAQHAAAVAEAARAAKGDAVLVVGHSNTVPAIIAALGGPKLPDLCDAQYANLFIVRLPAHGDASLVRAQYGASDAPDAGACVAAAMK